MIDCNADSGIDGVSFQTDGPNTRIAYVYRDADNFKQYEDVILAGALTLDEARAIVAATDALDGFVPSAVGLADLQDRTIDGWQADKDHPFHEISLVARVGHEPTGDLIAARFLALFLAADWEAEGERVIAQHADAS